MLVKYRYLTIAGIQINFFSKTLFYACCFIFLSGMIAGCSKIVEVGDPVSKVGKSQVFSNDEMATAAVTGVYVKMIAQEVFSSGNYQSQTSLTGLSSDELINYRPENFEEIQFQENKLLSNNKLILGFWTSAYNVIYQTNSNLEGLLSSEQISSQTKSQLLGEMYFVRAFCYFNLVNLFGDVPLLLETNYQNNARASRNDIDIIYKQIVKDLSEAQSLMNEVYPSADRVRPNKTTATAFLARVFLYQEEWEKAEIQASAIIDNPTYIIEPSLSDVFKNTSQEAIWQIMQNSRTRNTWEGSNFIIVNVPAHTYLSPELANSFEPEDLRLHNWVGTYNGVQVFHFPYKYKIRIGGPGSTTPVPVSEYSMVFRLAEIYLIRAEARARLNKDDLSIQDIDVIRERAGLPLIAQANPGISNDALLLAIEEERRHELFAEWGHRWLDLKRTNRADLVLAPKKADWTTSDKLYPIPDLEFSRNPFLGEQNSGY